MRLTVKEKNNLIIKKSRNGKGIFTKKVFLPEEVVLEVTGKFITCYEDEDIDDETRANTYPYDKIRYISPKGRIANFANHSCNPNSKLIKVKGKLFVAAIVPIGKGEEIFIDYSTMLAPDDIWEMVCNCGTKECRKIIKKINSLPKKLREKYISLGMVPDYIFS